MTPEPEDLAQTRDPDEPLGLTAEAWVFVDDDPVGAALRLHLSNVTEVRPSIRTTLERFGLIEHVEGIALDRAGTLTLRALRAILGTSHIKVYVHRPVSEFIDDAIAPWRMRVECDRLYKEYGESVSMPDIAASQYAEHLWSKADEIAEMMTTNAYASPARPDVTVLRSFMKRVMPSMEKRFRIWSYAFPQWNANTVWTLVERYEHISPDELSGVISDNMDVLCTLTVNGDPLLELWDAVILASVSAQGR